MFSNLLKAAVGIVTLPVDVIADVVTMGGALTDKPEPYTAKKASQIVRALSEASEPDKGS